MSAQSLNIAVRYEIERLGGLPPVERAKEAQRILRPWVARWLPELAQLRATAFRELHEEYGWSFRALADEFKVRKSQADRITKKAESA